MIKSFTKPIFTQLKQYTNNIFKPFKIRKQIKQYTNKYGNSAYMKSILQQINKQQQHIHQLQLYSMRSQECLGQWVAISDEEIGGESTSQLFYQDNGLLIKGNISAKNVDKLRSKPFIALLQQKPFAFKSGIFNTLRIQMKSDGKPIQIQMMVTSQLYGPMFAKATIINNNNNSNSLNWQIYQLPFRNFDVVGQESFNKSDYNNHKKVSVRSILNVQLVTPYDFEISNMALRMPSGQSCQRKINIKTIQLVRTIRGDIQNQKNYRRPYFYIVTPQNKDKDIIFQKIDTGAFLVTKLPNDNPIKNKLRS